MSQVILIVDDERAQREILRGFLKKLGYNVFTASCGKEGLDIVSNQIVDIVLTDFQMPDMTGMEVLEEIKKLNPEISVIMFTAYGSIERSVEAMKKGAEHYLIKPINLDELELSINKALDKRALISENLQLKKEVSEQYDFSQIIYKSKEMEEVMSLAARVASTKASVLIRGESGTGKELIARALHYASSRKNKTLVVVNCGVLNENLLISTLFGHEKGAFTGAIKQTRGKFEMADRGTVFIDEIGDLPFLAQIKLLRVLQEGNFERLGSEKPIEVDVRVIAATHRNLEDMLSDGTFREDLFYRLNVVTIRVPPLRERRDDLPALFDHFLDIFSKENNKKITAVSKEAFDVLMKYDYPGNIRELKNIMERAVILARGNQITTADLSENIKKREIKKVVTSTGSLTDQVENLERTLIAEALENTGGIKTKAAEILGISERNLRYKIKKLEMDSK